MTKIMATHAENYERDRELARVGKIVRTSQNEWALPFANNINAITGVDVVITDNTDIDLYDFSMLFGHGKRSYYARVCYDFCIDDQETYRVIFNSFSKIGYPILVLKRLGINGEGEEETDELLVKKVFSKDEVFHPIDCCTTFYPLEGLILKELLTDLILFKVISPLDPSYKKTYENSSLYEKNTPKILRNNEVAK